MLFGCNASHYDEISAQVTGITMVRKYLGVNQFPDPWPATPTGTVGMFSAKVDYAQLMAGTLDAEIKSSVSALPAGTWLAVYHERNLSSLNPFGYTGTQFKQIDTRMLELVHAANPSVKYGVILFGGPHLMNWTIDGLDFYAMDLYEGHAGSSRDVSAILVRNFNQLPSSALRAIAETNSSAPAHRSSWFRECYDWLQANNGGAMLTYWNPTGPLSGPWLPGDEAVIYALQQISDDARSNRQ
jgi:hypothetical protein